MRGILIRGRALGLEHRVQGLNVHRLLQDTSFLRFKKGRVQGVLGGSWDLVTLDNWGYNPTYNWGNPYKAI